MTQPLFFEPEAYIGKAASSVELPEDPNAWPHEVLQELYKQLPYIADFEPHVVMDRVDAEKGYGFGHVEVMNQTEAPAESPPDQMASAGIRTVRVPVIIRSGKLCPFDVLITDDSKMRPLTEGRLRQAIFRPQAFDVTARSPGDQSMIGQLYPPYRQNYGFGGGGVAMSAGMGKEGSDLERYLSQGAEPEATKSAAAIDDYFSATGVRHGRLGKKSVEGDAKVGMIDELLKSASADGGTRPSLLRQILPTINEEDYAKVARSLEPAQVRAALRMNKHAVAESLATLAEYESSRSKVSSALANLIRPTVVQVRRGDEGYVVKSASHLFWDPVEEVVGRGELVRRFGEKVALAADTEGAVTMADAAPAAQQDPDAQQAGPITESGLYKVVDTQGNEHIGQVVVGLVDSSGDELPLSLFTNGSKAAVQSDMFGVPAGDTFDLPTGDLSTKKGAGFFFVKDPDGGIQATIPFDLSSSTQGPDGNVVCQGETFDGRPAQVSVQPNIQVVVGTEDGVTLIPQGWQWSPLESCDALDVVSSDAEQPKEAQVRYAMGDVQVRCDGSTFSFSGHAVTKLAHSDREFVDVDGAMFLLAALGVDQSVGVKKLGRAMAQRAPETVRVGRPIKTAAAQSADAVAYAQRSVPNLRKDLVKEATYIPDPVAVDTVLSLGFINPENVMTFISYLPVLDDAQSRMCELLIASRLGLQTIPESALEKAIRSSEEAIEGLKVLAFHGG